MSTTNYSPSHSAAGTEIYIRGQEDERGVAISCDVPGGPGAFSDRARALTQNTNRDVEALHYRQSFSDEELDPNKPEDVQRVNDLGYQLSKKMHPQSDCLVVTHTDGRGGKAHNHVVVINHDNESGKALSNYRTFKDRPEMGNQRGVKSANDELMREHDLSVVKTLTQVPKDWELRREDFVEGGLDREMGDRFDAALDDPRSVDKTGLEKVLDEQNQQVDVTGEQVPRMRLHSTIRKKGKNTGKETWTLYIEDGREDANRAERRKRTSVLSADFTPEGAQEFFDYHSKQKEHENERETRQAEAADRAARIAADADGQSGDGPHLDLASRRHREAEHTAGHGDRPAGETGAVREGHEYGTAGSLESGFARHSAKLDRERTAELGNQIRAHTDARSAERRKAELSREQPRKSAAAIAVKRDRDDGLSL